MTATFLKIWKPCESRNSRTVRDNAKSWKMCIFGMW